MGRCLGKLLALPLGPYIPLSPSPTGPTHLPHGDPSTRLRGPLCLHLRLPCLLVSLSPSTTDRAPCEPAFVSPWALGREGRVDVGEIRAKAGVPSPQAGGALHFVFFPCHPRGRGAHRTSPAPPVPLPAVRVSWDWPSARNTVTTTRRTPRHRSCSGTPRAPEGPPSAPPPPSARRKGCASEAPPTPPCPAPEGPEGRGR